MVRSDDFVVELNLLDKDDTPYVGGKNANLGEMIHAGFPVPRLTHCAVYARSTMGSGWKRFFALGSA